MRPPVALAAGAAQAAGLHGPSLLACHVLQFFWGVLFVCSFVGRRRGIRAPLCVFCDELPVAGGWVSGGTGQGGHDWGTPGQKGCLVVCFGVGRASAQFCSRSHHQVSFYSSCYFVTVPLLAI